MENGESKAQKKHKKNQKRTYEEAEHESVQEVVTKKEKKNKKKHETLNNDEFVSELGGKTETCNGSSEKSKKKKKKKNHEEDGVEKGSLRDGSDENSGEKKGLDNCGNSKNIDGGENFETRESSDGVVVSGIDVKNLKYEALKSFADSGLPNEVIDCCKNFNKPSPIQSHSWPFLLNGRDFIGIAATGSGDFAFILLSKFFGYTYSGF